MVAQRSSVPAGVVETVAAATDRDPVDLPPLYESVDPDALDACVASMASGTVTFSYAGYAVTVDDEGSVDLTEESPADFD